MKQDFQFLWDCDRISGIFPLWYFCPKHGFNTSAGDLALVLWEKQSNTGFVQFQKLHIFVLAFLLIKTSSFYETATRFLATDTCAREKNWKFMFLPFYSNCSDCSDRPTILNPTHGQSQIFPDQSPPHLPSPSPDSPETQGLFLPPIRINSTL